MTSHFHPSITLALGVLQLLLHLSSYYVSAQSSSTTTPKPLYVTGTLNITHLLTFGTPPQQPPTLWSCQPPSSSISSASATTAVDHNNNITFYNGTLTGTGLSPTIGPFSFTGTEYGYGDGSYKFTYLSAIILQNINGSQEDTLIGTFTQLGLSGSDFTSPVVYQSVGLIINGTGQYTNAQGTFWINGTQDHTVVSTNQLRSAGQAYMAAIIVLP